MSKMQRTQVSNFNPIAERVVISSLIAHGEDSFFPISSYLDTNDFYLPENKLIFAAIKKLITEESIKKPDVLTITKLIDSMDKEAVNRYSITDHIVIMSNDATAPDSIDPFCKIVKRFSVIRGLTSKLQDAISYLQTVDGTESITDIICQAEKPFSEFITLVNNTDETIAFKDHLLDYAIFLATTKPTVQGVKSGFNRLDYALGGCLDSPGYHVIGARSGVGKSFILLNIGISVAESEKDPVPVLYLDTELTPQKQMDRTLALISGVKLDRIKNGSFDNSPAEKDKVFAAIKKREQIPFHYQNISGKPYQEWLSIARKWILQKVGLNQNGKAKRCLLIIDYLKSMDLSHNQNHQEYQVLGQLATDLHNFCVQYEIPCLCAVQLNRDAITRDDDGVVSGSDRILWLSTSLTLLKRKDQDDYADDPEINGNMKLITLKARNGPGMETSEYVNIIADLSVAKMREGNTNLENRRNRNETTAE